MTMIMTVTKDSNNDNEDHDWVDDENDGNGDDWVMMKMPGKRC